MSEQALALLRGQVASTVIGAVFLFIGLATGAIGAIRRRSGTRIFLWLGTWSAMYGTVELSQTPAVVAALPVWAQIGAPFANTAMTYLMVVAGMLSFMELSRGVVRRLTHLIIVAGLAIAAVGIASFVLTGARNTLVLYNNLLATAALAILTAVVAVPKLSRKYLVLPRRGVLTIGTLIFALEALYVNLARPLGLSSSRLVDNAGFAVLLFSFGYVALQLVLTNEHRLLVVDKELAIARDIQASILPGSVPELKQLRISAAYRPMTAVAGDFYDFLAVDQDRIGLLVADVCGHGVPAALIASMIKVAGQSVVECANDPGAVLGGLNRVLSRQLRGQLVSAAYLWLDTAQGTALYSAAGHPPLLRWREGKLERIESNGLLFGVMPDVDHYPVRTLPLVAGDRFLLCTDGVTEPENAQGESFGDARLEDVVRGSALCGPSEASDRLLMEISRWQPASTSQQDDITLIVIDAF